ncbi:hypothetical protein [Vibrio phage Va2]|nr:hypothetical protein [Vibrio phage Va2]
MNTASKILSSLESMDDISEAIQLTWGAGNDGWNQKWIKAVSTKYSDIFGKFIKEKDISLNGKPAWILIFQHVSMIGKTDKKGQGKITHAIKADQSNFVRSRTKATGGLNETELNYAGYSFHPIPKNSKSIKDLVKALEGNENSRTTLATKHDYASNFEMEAELQAKTREQMMKGLPALVKSHFGVVLHEKNRTAPEWNFEKEESGFKFRIGVTEKMKYSLNGYEKERFDDIVDELRHLMKQKSTKDKEASISDSSLSGGELERASASIRTTPAAKGSFTGIQIIVSKKNIKFVDGAIRLGEIDISQKVKELKEGIYEGTVSFRKPPASRLGTLKFDRKSKLTGTEFSAKDSNDEMVLYFYVMKEIDASSITPNHKVPTTPDDIKGKIGTIETPEQSKDTAESGQDSAQKVVLGNNDFSFDDLESEVSSLGLGGVEKIHSWNMPANKQFMISFRQKVASVVFDSGLILHLAARYIGKNLGRMRVVGYHTYNTDSDSDIPKQMKKKGNFKLINAGGKPMVEVRWAGPRDMPAGGGAPMVEANLEEAAASMPKPKEATTAANLTSSLDRVDTLIDSKRSNLDIAHGILKPLIRQTDSGNDLQADVEMRGDRLFLSVEVRGTKQDAVNSFNRHFGNALNEIPKELNKGEIKSQNTGDYVGDYGMASMSITE